MKSALLNFADTDSQAWMPAVRNRAADIVIRFSSFLVHCSFRHSSLSLAWDIDNRLSAKTHDSQAIGTADYQRQIAWHHVDLWHHVDFRI